MHMKEQGIKCWKKKKTDEIVIQQKLYPSLSTLSTSAQIIDIIDVINLFCINFNSFVQSENIVSRAIFVYTEPTVMDQIKTGESRDLLFWLNH